MKKLQLLNGCVASILLVLPFMTLGSSPVIAADVCDKKPDLPKCNPVDPPPDPDPDPEDPGSLCADSESYFPAFAYAVSTQLDNDPYSDYTEIFLSNAKGNCAIKVYETNEDSRATQMSYRYFPDNTGRIVFTELKFIDELWASAPNQIKMLDFSINDGVIVEDLPLSSRLLAQAPDVDGIKDGSLSMPDLSPLGDRVVFLGSDNDDTYFIDEIEIACASEPSCRQRIFETQPDVNGEYVYLGHPFYSLEKERIYFELGHPNKKVVFVEKEGGIWPALNYDSGDLSLSSEPTLILDGEGDVLNIRSVGVWDYDNSGVAREVIAMPRRITSDLDSIEILDVEACLETAPPGAGSCVALGVGSESGIVIEGDTLLPISFTSFSNNPPALLLRKYIGRRNESSSILEVNLNDFSEQILINAIKDRKKTIGSIDSAD